MTQGNAEGNDEENSEEMRRIPSENNKVHREVIESSPVRKSPEQLKVSAALCVKDKEEIQKNKQTLSAGQPCLDRELPITHTTPDRKLVIDETLQVSIRMHPPI